MQWINTLKLKPKLMLTFGIVMVIMLIQGIIAYAGLAALNNVTRDLAGDAMSSVREAGELRGLVGEYRNSAYQSMVRASDAVKKEARDHTVALKKQIDATIADYPRLVHTAEQ